MFQKAVKHESKLRLAIAGPSGSGKTYSALAIGTALANGGRVAVVDTEHGSASKYADIFDFDVMNMDAPFHPHRYAMAIKDAAQAGYAVVILDSMSHAWFATGGVLDIVDEAAKRSKSGNTYMAWKEGTPVQNELIEAITSAAIHVIGTMRSKTEYTLVTGANGKQAPQKMGMAPVQREGFEYEFDVMFDMDIANNAIVTKSRCSALSGGVYHQPGADVAGILRDWLHGAAVDKPTGEIVEIQEEGEHGELLPQRRLNRLHALGTQVYGDAWDDKRPELVTAISKNRVTSSKGLSVAEVEKLITGLEKKAADLNEATAATQAAAFAEMPSASGQYGEDD